MRGLVQDRTAVMGILNVTPDSFFDEGAYASLDPAADRARAMLDEGADLIDIGGESTRPGAGEVSEGEELTRTIPVVEVVSALGVPVSIDTRKAVVAKAAIDAGAVMVNDVSAGTFDQAMFPLVADRRVPVILMHMRGTPKTMDSHATYDDVTADVRGELADRVDSAVQAGVDAANILLDPGLGFAKTADQSMQILREVAELKGDGFPIVVGPSRKRFIGGEISDRLPGTLAAVAWCAMHDVDVVRVHDVAAARRVVDMIARLR